MHAGMKDYGAPESNPAGGAEVEPDLSVSRAPSSTANDLMSTPAPGDAPAGDAADGLELGGEDVMATAAAVAAAFWARRSLSYWAFAAAASATALKPSFFFLPNIF